MYVSPVAASLIGSTFQPVCPGNKSITRQRCVNLATRLHLKDHIKPCIIPPPLCRRQNPHLAALCICVIVNMLMLILARSLSGKWTPFTPPPDTGATIDRITPAPHLLQPLAPPPPTIGPVELRPFDRSPGACRRRYLSGAVSLDDGEMELYLSWPFLQSQPARQRV